MRRATACLLLATALVCPPLAAQDPAQASPEQVAAMQAYQRTATPGPAHAGLAIRWERPSVDVLQMYAAGPDGKEMKMMEMTNTLESGRGAGSPQ